MLEKLTTLGYNRQLLATQQHIGGDAILGYNRQLLATQKVVLERLATLGYYRQLLATRQHIECGAGEAGNTGLQQATAGNSATHWRWCNTGLQ